MAAIVSVHSFRGGTGKSNLTANLATVIAAQGKRVGIVDTDIQSPGIHVIFGLEDKQITRSLNDYLWGRCGIVDAAYPISLPGLAGTIHLVPSSLRTGEITRVLREGYDVSLLNDGFQSLLQQLKLDFLFIDTHPGLNEETLLSIAVSDVLVLILRPDQQDFQGTAVTVEVARKLEVPRMLLVVNKAPPALDLKALRDQVHMAYQAPVAGMFQYAPELAELGSAGVFCRRYPDHPFTRELRQVAAQIVQ